VEGCRAAAVQREYPEKLREPAVTRVRNPEQDGKVPEQLVNVRSQDFLDRSFSGHA
jgi:hypothetical protein